MRVLRLGSFTLETIQQKTIVVTATLGGQILVEGLSSTDLEPDEALTLAKILVKAATDAPEEILFPEDKL